MRVDIGGARRGVREFLQVMYTKLLDICYDFAAVFNLFFVYPLSVECCPMGRRWYYSHGVFPWAVSTNHCCIWLCLAASCDARFDRGL